MGEYREQHQDSLRFAVNENSGVTCSGLLEKEVTVLSISGRW